MDMKKRTDLFLILCGILVWFLADAPRLRAAAAEALALCGHSVIPALFPFLVVSSLLISLGFGEWLSPALSGLMTPLFRLPGLAGSAWILGLVGGYPIGAQTAADLYRSHLLTREETERLLTFCSNANPVFFLSILGSGVFASLRTGLWLWLIHILSSLLTGLLYRGRGKTAGRRQLTREIPCRAVSLPAAFVAAVRSSAAGMLSVCAFVTLFYAAASPLAELGGRLGPALVGMAELFSLTPLLGADRFSFILASGCAGWGGVSVLCQTAAVLEDTDLSVRPCLVGKLTQGILSALLAGVLSPYILA